MIILLRDQSATGDLLTQTFVLSKMKIQVWSKTTFEIVHAQTTFVNCCCQAICTVYISPEATKQVKKSRSGHKLHKSKSGQALLLYTVHCTVQYSTAIGVLYKKINDRSSRTWEIRKTIGKRALSWNPAMKQREKVRIIHICSIYFTYFIKYKKYHNKRDKISMKHLYLARTLFYMLLV